MVRRVRSRDFAISEDPRREPREVGELMTSFVAMARELEAFTRDLEERVAERTAELEQERRRLKLIIDRLPDAVGLSGPDGALLVCNSTYERLLGGRDRSRVAQVLSGEATPQGYRRHADAEGESHLLDVRVYPLADDDEAQLDDVQLEHLRDMTRLCNVEAALATSQKLAAIGRLASGIAHEINNPLTAIAACAEGLQRRLATPPLDHDTFAEYLEIVRREVFRCKEVTEKLLDLARPRREQPQRFLAMEPVSSTIRLLSPLAERRGIRLESTGGGDVEVDTDRRAVEQIVLNLLLNAIEASDDGGSVTLSIRAGQDDVEIVVVDKGHGIDPAVLPRLFEPFFTRRRKNNGSGLGLFVCQGLADALGGSIAVASDGPGRGATFSLRLPRRLRGDVLEAGSAG
jgi:signal transduction histidine kinase